MDYEQLRLAVEIKSELLSHGVSLTAELFENFGLPYLEKRRAYGNQDPFEIREKRIPQEVYVYSDKIVSAVHVRESPWCLTYENNNFFAKHGDGRSIQVSFPLRPKFYDKPISSKQKVNQIITLYGGKSLAVFVYGTCSLVLKGMPCHYCSIDPNRSKPNDFEHVIKPWQLESALRIALCDSDSSINQVMINGGSFPDLNKNFLYYVELVKTARRVLDEFSRDIQLHLIVFPPEKLELIDLLKDTGVSIAMNTEVFNSGLFEKYCPGKKAALGQENIFKALQRAVDVLGEGKVYSILVGGLEPHESFTEGLYYLAHRKVTPVVNVFHPDPCTPLGNHRAPTSLEILEMGKSLQKVYDENQFMTPFYSYCGRNSLDSEAYLKLFC